jgi:glycosyltransferase involved in cell wall biosynthesis
MRVLHVVATGQRRGAEVFASDLVRALGGPGIEQRVAVVRNGVGSELSYDADVLSLGAGDGHRPFPGIRLDIGGVQRLREALERWEPEVVQAHGGEPLKYALSAARRRGIPTVYRRIGAAPARIRTGPRRFAHAYLMRKAAKVVTVAEALRREAIERFSVPESRIVVIPNGIDAARIAPTKSRSEIRRTLGVRSNEPLILSLGAITWEKDPLAHVAVSERVAAARPDARHLIVGDGPMREQMRGEVTRRGLDRSVSFLGTRTDVGNLLTAADALLFASRPDGMEGMPAQIIEAGMSGLPVVGYAVAGVPEVVRDQETGLLVRPGDVDALAGAVLQLFSDDTARRAMGTKARARCASFEIAAIAPRYRSLYEVLAAREEVKANDRNGS